MTNAPRTHKWIAHLDYDGRHFRPTAACSKAADRPLPAIYSLHCPCTFQVVASPLPAWHRHCGGCGHIEEAGFGSLPKEE